MPNWIIEEKVDLTKTPKREMTAPYALMFPGDASGHTWRVHVCENGQPVNMGGGSVAGYFLRPDGGTIVVSGSAAAGEDPNVSNVLSVTLPATVYAYPGIVKAGLRHTKSGVKTTVAYRLLNILPTYDSETYIDPGSSIPDIDDLLEMIENMEYAVRYDSSQSLTDAQKAQARANIGATTGAVLYSELQNLTAGQKTNARMNIGVAFADDNSYPGNITIS